MLVRLAITTIILGASHLQLSAQKWAITPFSGYTLSNSFEINGGNATVGEGLNYGAYVGYTPSEHWEVELMYSHLTAKTEATSTLFPEFVFYEQVRLHYLLAGVNWLGMTNSGLQWLGGVKIGSASMVFPDNNVSSISRFALGLNGGARYFFTPTMGVRLQGQVLLPVNRRGTALWWDPGTGTTQIGTTSAISMVQLALHLGVVLAF